MNLLRKYYDKDSIGGGIPDEVRIEKAYQLLKERAKESYLSHASFSASPFGLDGIPYVQYDAISKLMVEFSDSELSLASEKLKEKDEEISRLKAENERLRGEVKEYQIDFSGNLLCKISVTKNIIKVEGAMNGFGDSISLNEVSITEIKKK